MNNTMIPILPELKSAMKQVTKQYQSDFDLDTKVIQKAAKEAKADGKPQTFLWFCRESGTYIARESNAYLKESPMYISYHYYADQQRREAKGLVLRNVDIYILVDGMNDKSAEEKVALELKI